MHVGRKTQKREKSAMTVSLYGNLFFVIVELVIAIITSSQAVLLDAVYDGVEFFMLLPSIFLIPLLYKPSNEKHPFGYMQIETLFVVVKGITMTAVTLGLIANNINLMLHGGHIISFSTVAYFELSACILGIGVSLYLKRKNRVMNSPLIEMEMQGWQIDSIISLGMTAAFLLPMFVPFRWFQVLIPYVDQIITVVLSLFMIPVPIKTVITGIRDLILIPPEEETIEEIKATVEPVINSYQHRKLYYDIVRTGRKLWISVYITFEKDEISLSRFKIVQTRCIEALAEKYTDFYFELLPDIEFTGLESEPKSKDKASAKEENDGNISSEKEKDDENISSGKEKDDGSISFGKEKGDGNISFGKEKDDGSISSGKKKDDGSISFGKEKIDENTGNGETIKKDTTATQEDNAL